MNAADIESITKDPPASPSSAPDATASARAALEAVHANPFASTREREAAQQGFDAAYRAKYGGEPLAPAETLTADPAIAGLSPDGLRGRITAIRRLLTTAVDGGDDHQVLMTDLHAAYARLHPEGQDAAEAAAAPPRALEDGPPLPDGMSWNTIAWQGLHASAPDADARRALGGLQNALAGALHDSRSFTDADADAALGQLVGEWQLAKTKALAEAVLAHPAAAPYREQLTAAGLHRHPKVRMALADIGARLRATA